MTYTLTTNLKMEDFPDAGVQQTFDTIDDLLVEIKESLTKYPDMKLTIEVND